MISVKQAKKIIDDHTFCMPREKVCLSKALGRVLAQDIRAKSDWPPFTRATMDGFALRQEDARRASPRHSALLKVIGLSRAGASFQGRVAKGQAVQIMTGAVVPKGANSVVRQEDTRLQGDYIHIFRKPGMFEHIRRKGQDVRRNRVVIPCGTRIHPGMIALMANFGFQQVLVYQKPTVAILVTGHELVGVHEKPGPGEIRSANEHALAGLVGLAGAQAVVLGIVQDHLPDLRAKINKGLQYDMLLISGGVSVGAYDLSLKALQQSCVQSLFWKVAIKPGKPLFFGKRKSCLVFGLPGNTASSMVSFEKFVKPCLWQMSGLGPGLNKTTPAILHETITVEPQRHKVMRGFLFRKGTTTYVRLAGHQISENVVSLAQSNCFFEIKPGITTVKKGSCVCVQYF